MCTELRNGNNSFFVFCFIYFFYFFFFLSRKKFDLTTPLPPKQKELFLIPFFFTLW